MRGSFQRDLSQERAKADRARRRRDAAPVHWIIVRWLMVAAVWVVVFIVGMFAYVYTTLPQTDAWMAFDHRDSVTIHADNDAVVAVFGDAHGENLHLGQMPRCLIDAVLATEDRRFYHHHGIDPVGLARAAWVDLQAGAVLQGGSTITQQLAKNAFLTPDRTILRKTQEIALALWLEQHYTKDQILETYLNRIYFGASAYGVDAAARRYFGKSARSVDLAESALLAGLPRAPSRFSPINDPELARARAQQVLLNMVADHVLTPDQAAIASAELSHLPMAPVVHSGVRYFADWIQDQIADAGYHGDMTVMTTLDPKLQAEAETSVSRVLDRDGARLRAGEAALVSMAPDGAIRAMVGGRDYAKSPFNRVTQAHRQPGSAFKIFVYLTALERGYTPGDRFFDGPVSIDGWQPHDDEPGYRGDVTMADAVALSLNTVAAQVAEKVGVDNVIATARRLGITDPLADDASIALGTSNVTLLQLTAAYAVLDRDGQGVEPYGIISLRDASGKILFQRSGDAQGQAADSDKAALMTRMLKGVIAYGTGRAAAIGRPAAGKTGTTSDFRDAWFIGYTPDLVTGVWFGNDDDSPMRHVTGGSLPAETWRDFMVLASKGVPIRALDEYEATPGAVAGSEGPVARVFHHVLGFFGLGHSEEDVEPVDQP